MKKIFLFYLLMMSAATAFSQPNFAYYYTPTPGASSYVYPVVAVAYDGSIMGISTSIPRSISIFLLFKIDINGNMLWQKDIYTGLAELFVHLFGHFFNDTR